MATEFSAAAVPVGAAEISATEGSAVADGAAAPPTATRLAGVLNGPEAEISAAPTTAVALTAALDFVARHRRHALDRCRHLMVNTVFGDASPPGYTVVFCFLFLFFVFCFLFSFHNCFIYLFGSILFCSSLAWCTLIIICFHSFFCFIL